MRFIGVTIFRALVGQQKGELSFSFFYLVPLGWKISAPCAATKYNQTENDVLIGSQYDSLILLH